VPSAASHDPSLARAAGAVWLSLGIAVCAGPVILLNRALLPGLLGARSGIGTVLDVLFWLGSFGAQLVALLLVLWFVHTVRRELSQPWLASTERAFLLPAAAAMTLLLIAASQAPLSPELLLVCSVVAGLACASAVPAALSSPRTRAAGLMLGLVALAIVAHSGARALVVDLAAEPSHQQLFDARRAVTWLTHSGLLLELLAALLLSVWLLTTTKGRFWPFFAVALSLGVGLVVLARQPFAADSLLPVLSFRALGALGRVAQNDPLGLSVALLRGFQLLLGFGLLLLRRRTLLERAALSNLLFGQVASDMPLHAGLTVSAALLIATLGRWRGEERTLSPPSPDGISRTRGA